jgi:hypothetical protein
MRKSQIENWANQVIERVIRAQPREDSFEELKPGGLMKQA